MAQATLYPHNHAKYPHTPINVAEAHKAQFTGFHAFNIRVALFFARLLGTPWAFYLFMCLALSGFPGFQATLPQLVQWVSQTVIQLVALALLQILSDHLNEKSDMQAEQTFHFQQRIYHLLEESEQHQHAQDAYAFYHTEYLHSLREILLMLAERLAPTLTFPAEPIPPAPPKPAPAARTKRTRTPAKAKAAA